MIILHLLRPFFFLLQQSLRISFLKLSQLNIREQFLFSSLCQQPISILQISTQVLNLHVKLFFSNLCPCWEVHVLILTGQEIKTFHIYKIFHKILIAITAELSMLVHSNFLTPFFCVGRLESEKLTFQILLMLRFWMDALMRNLEDKRLKVWDGAASKFMATGSSSRSQPVSTV